MTDWETRDVRLASVAKAFAALVAAAAAAALLSWAALRILTARFPAAVSRTAPPPEPRLQADPAGDLLRLRAEEDAELSGYGWSDRARGRIRIPIERAMALLAERGLPTKSPDGRRP